MNLSRRIRIVLWIIVGVLTGLVAGIAIVVIRFQPLARGYVISALERRYESKVELGSFQISLFPMVKATGENLVFRWGGRTDLPPMIAIRRFTVEARFVGFFRYPKHIRKLKLEGLQVHIPPKSERSHGVSSGRASDAPFLLEEVDADGTKLETLPSNPGKQSLMFDIHQLHLHSVGRYRPMTFQATLENPKPPGLIHTTGQFGPWNQDAPGGTPVSGQYTFSDADLAVFKGIMGILSSTGSYHGEMDRIEVQGTTDVPNFALTTGNHPMHLHTEFAATVDGTNGNTDLHPVRATLGQSTFEVTGSIERSALETHKEIDLQATAKSTGLADFLRLTVKAQNPPMTGRVAFQTKVKIPPGDNPVVERMQLDGAFNLNGVKFTSPEVQQKIASLSHHAQGEPKDTDASDVAADFEGYFHLRNGTLRLPQLRFEVPGAHVSLDGQYALPSGNIDFRGTAKLDATVSQMATGWKHVLLKPLDPLFKRDGAGAVLPIRITGKRGSPSFKLDIGRVLSRD
ncbi:MAG TPA: AsmA-like C-terminal region-containing protein [Bryobacteraceae bacterium]|nr:AsmA-like C-terminal region-containing protein [Bryobacteraceae bacterium]